MNDSEAGSLKRAAIWGTLWTLLGFGGSQALRLGSNIILARLLDPVAFGLMAIIGMFIAALATFSDVGIQPAIVQHKRGDDPIFVNTAWSIQAIRGVLLTVAAGLLAFPIARFYDQPLLLFALPVAGLNALCAGFESTALATASRKVMLGRLTLVDLLSQCLCIATMIVWAMQAPTVWALVAGGLVAAASRLVLSHVLLHGIPHRFHIDTESRRELMRFGRWIFVSTAFTFIASQGDRLLLSTFMPVATLGVYYMASQLAQAVMLAGGQVSQRVLFPIYARMATQPGEDVVSRVRKMRIGLLALCLPIPAVLIAFGEAIVHLLFGDKYAEAGWILRALSCGVVIDLLVLTVAPVVLAYGDSFRHMAMLISRAVLLTVCTAVGATIAGLQGVVAGVVVAQVLGYFVLAWAVSKYNAWSPALDLAALGYAAAIVGVCHLISQVV